MDLFYFPIDHTITSSSRDQRHVSYTLESLTDLVAGRVLVTYLNVNDNATEENLLNLDQSYESKSQDSNK